MDFLRRDRAVLAVVDVQERLLPAIPEERRVTTLKNVLILIQAARTLGLPIVVSEQYPEGPRPDGAGSPGGDWRRVRTDREDRLQLRAFAGVPGRARSNTPARHHPLRRRGARLRAADDDRPRECRLSGERARRRGCLAPNTRLGDRRPPDGEGRRNRRHDRDVRLSVARACRHRRVQDHRQARQVALQRNTAATA